jgi:ornithine carrier protein
MDSPSTTTTQTTSPPATSTLLSSHALEALKDIGFGSLAGIVSKSLEYPFDTIKVRLQSQPDHLPLRYKGPLDCFRQSIAEEGFRGLYRGVSAPLVGAMAENACLFWAYRVTQDVLRSTILPRAEEEKLPLSALIFAGGVAGCFTSFVLTPIELVKCRMQVPFESAAAAASLSSAPRPIAASPLAVIADVWRRDGLAGFWRGQLGTLLRETGGGMAWFGSYETLTMYFRSLQPSTTSTITNNSSSTSSEDTLPPLPIYQQMLSGAAAGMSYNFVFYPADTIKSKMQTMEVLQGEKKPSFVGVGRELWRSHGLKGMYRGCGLTVARSAPSSALIFTIYEALRKNLG